MKREIYLGLDVGGTKVEGAIALIDMADRSTTVLSKKRFQVQKEESFDVFINSVLDLISSLIELAQIKPNELLAIGAGLPGSIDPISKRMLNGNTRFLIGQDFISTLKNKLKDKFDLAIPIYVQNDANLFAFAESYLGVGKQFEKNFHIPFEKQVVVGITLGTGVGGGLVSNGKLLNGAHGSAMEVGHMSLNPSGHHCYCGQNGCAETYLSGTALSKLAPFFDSKKLFEAIDSNADAQHILNIYRMNLVHFLSVLNNLFNPHYFVFGGGLSSQQIIFKDLKEELKKNIFLSETFCPEIYINQLGDSAGLFGAMVYAKENLSH